MILCEHDWRVVGPEVHWCVDCGRIKDRIGSELGPLKPVLPNGLTLAQQELFLKLSEESLEVAHVCQKILLYGLNDTNPVDPSKGTNLDRLHHELGDVRAIESILLHEDLIHMAPVEDAWIEKLRVLNRWLKHYHISDYFLSSCESTYERIRLVRETAGKLKETAKRLRNNLTDKEREVLDRRFGAPGPFGRPIKGENSPSSSDSAPANKGTDE